jgi:hypothetical protein
VQNLVRNGGRLLGCEAFDRPEVSRISRDESSLLELRQDVSKLKLGCELFNITLQLTLRQVGERILDSRYIRSVTVIATSSASMTGVTYFAERFWFKLTFST